MNFCIFNDNFWIERLYDKLGCTFIVQLRMNFRIFIFTGNHDERQSADILIFSLTYLSE